MSKKGNVYWKQKDGTLINVDDMSEDHVRKTLKMMLRNIERKRLEAVRDRIEKAVPKVREVRLNGDMAQQFNDQQEQYLLEEDDSDFPY